MRTARFGLLIVLGLFAGMAACSPPPQGVQSAPASPPRTDETATPSEDATDEAYAFEREGEFPAADRDVVFEEDRLPPRPEEVVALPMGEAGDGAVEVQDVEAPAALPIPAARNTPVEPEVVVPVQEQQPPSTARGFRVQLLAAGDRDEAESMAREARARLRAPVYVVFEAPFYKVRAGDHVDRADALLLRDLARRNGYDGAWVVTTEIRLEP